MWGQPSAVRPREAWQGSDAPEKAQKETKWPPHLCDEAIFF